MRFSEVLEAMVQSPGDVYCRIRCLEYWRYDSETRLIQCKFGEEGTWSAEVVISQKDMTTNEWELWESATPYVSPKNNNVELFAADLVERTARLEEHISRIDRRIDTDVPGLVTRVVKLEDLMRDAVAVLEKHRDQIDELEDKREVQFVDINKIIVRIDVLEEYHQIVTSNLLRLSLRLDKVECVTQDQRKVMDRLVTASLNDEERLSSIDRGIKLLDSRISGHVKVTTRRLESQDNAIGNHIECQERNAQCQDRRINELELAINKISTVLRQHEAWFNKEDYKNE